MIFRHFPQFNQHFSKGSGRSQGRAPRAPGWLPERWRRSSVRWWVRTWQRGAMPWQMGRRGDVKSGGFTYPLVI